MIGRVRDDSSRLIASVFEHLDNLLVTTLSGHLDQRAIVQAVPFGIRAGIEQKPHGFHMSFARRKVHHRRIPVFGPSQARMALEQPPQCRDVTSARGDDRVPRVAPIRRFEFDRLYHRRGHDYTSGNDPRTPATPGAGIHSRTSLNNDEIKK